MQKTQEKMRSLTRGMRRLMINAEPMVGHIAKKAHKRIYGLHDLKAPGDFFMRANSFREAMLIYRGRKDWLGMSMASLKSGNEKCAVEALLRYGFSKRGALLFIGHTLSQDGMHRGAAMLFSECGMHRKAIRECLEIGDRNMTRQDRRRLALAYVRRGEFGLAGMQFRLSGLEKLADRMYEISAMQAPLLQSQCLYSNMIGMPLT